MGFWDNMSAGWGQIVDFVTGDSPGQIGDAPGPAPPSSEGGDRAARRTPGPVGSPPAIVDYIAIIEELEAGETVRTLQATGGNDIAAARDRFRSGESLEVVTTQGPAGEVPAGDQMDVQSSILLLALVVAIAGGAALLLR